MSDARSGGPSDDKRIQAAWSRIANCLEARKRQLYETIRNYPTPITACDQQFNYLLEQQAKIVGELRRAHELRVLSAVAIEDFVRSSSCLDDEIAQIVLSGLNRPN